MQPWTGGSSVILSRLFDASAASLSALQTTASLRFAESGCSASSPCRRRHSSIVGAEVSLPAFIMSGCSPSVQRSPSPRTSRPYISTKVPCMTEGRDTPTDCGSRPASAARDSSRQPCESSISATVSAFTAKAPCPRGRASSPRKSPPPSARRTSRRASVFRPPRRARGSPLLSCA